MFDRRQELCLQCCQFAQCWDLVEIGKVSEAILRRQQLCPRSEKRQLIEGIPALPGEGASPPPSIELSRVGIESFDAGDHCRGGRCQLIKAQPRSHERGGLGMGRGLQFLLKLSEPGRSVSFRSCSCRSVHENPQGVA